MKLNRTVEPHAELSYNEIDKDHTTFAKKVEETPFLAFIISKFVKNQKTKICGFLGFLVF